MSEEVLKQLESILPPRPAFKMPVGEHVEEVALHPFDGDRGAQGSRGEAYASDDEDHMHGSSGIQCAQQ